MTRRGLFRRGWGWGVAARWGLVSAAVVWAAHAGQAQEPSSEPTVSKAEVDACIRDFSVEKADLSDPAVRPYLHLLSEYFGCRTAVRDSSDACRLLSDPGLVASCRTSFDSYYGFFGRLILDGSVTSRVLAGCGRLKNLPNEQNFCQKMAEPILKQDPGLCEKLDPDRKRGCAELASPRGGTTNNKAVFMTALRLKNVSSCDTLEDTFARGLCRGAIGRMERLCEDGEGYKTFRQVYCSVAKKRGAR